MPSSLTEEKYAILTSIGQASNDHQLHVGIGHKGNNVCDAGRCSLQVGILPFNRNPLKSTIMETGQGQSEGRVNHPEQHSSQFQQEFPLMSGNVPGGDLHI